jgi:hypothetical protein
VNILVRDASGRDTGVRADGSVSNAIPWSVYYQSDINPAAVLPEHSEGPFEIIITGVETGDFNLAISSSDLVTLTSRQVGTAGQIWKGERRVFGASFTAAPGGVLVGLEPRPIATLSLASEYVAGLPAGFARSLEAKLAVAAAALSDGQSKRRLVAINVLHAFIHEVGAQKGKALTNDQADLLDAWARGIIDQIGQ